LGVFGLVGRFAVRHKWSMIGAWLILLLGSMVLLPSLLATLATPSLRVEGSPSAQAAETMTRGFPSWGEEQYVVTFRSPTLSAGDPAYVHAVTAGLRALAAQPGVGAVQALPPGDRQDGRHLYALAGFHGDDHVRQRRLPAQHDALRRATAEASGGRVEAALVGMTPVLEQVKEADLADLRLSEVIAVPVSLLALLLGLGVVGAALIPLAVAGTAVGVTVGVLAVANVSGALGVDTLMLTVACSSALAWGLDYSLLILLRHRQTRAVADAGQVHASVDAAGRTVAWCALAMVVMACCLLTVRAESARTLAFSAVVAAVVAMAAALTLLPATLAVAGRWLEFGALRRRGRPAAGGAGGTEGGPAEAPGGWERWARHLMRRPWPYALAASAVLLLAAAPALGVRLGIDFDRPSFARTPAGWGLTQMERDGVAAVNTILLPHRPGTPPVDTFELVEHLHSDPRITLAVPSDNGRDLTMVTVLTRQPSDDPGGPRLIDDIRHRLVPRLLPSGQPVLVLGATATLVDLHRESVARFGHLAILVLACCLVFLLVALRSLLLPLKAIVMNLLAVGAALGLLTLLFQHAGGGAERINSLLPLTVFTVVFGMSMDYEVFLVHRITERYRATGDNATAVAHGLERSARTITLAAAVMIITFGSLLFATRQELRQIGFTLAVAILIDATVVRLILVPALMQLLGHRNWWLPGPLARLLPPPRP
jgi:RND superfamily putative drug exporter